MTSQERIISTMQRCQGQFARPSGLDMEAYQTALDQGLLKFNEWPSGHFVITKRGQDYITDYAEEIGL